MSIIGIILAAGTSSRFNCNIPKQLYCINDTPILEYSINSMIKLVDKLIIVINKDIVLKDIIVKYKNIIIIENNINERKTSLNICIKYIQKNLNNVDKVIIHDSARPFVTKTYFEELLKQKEKYNQYALSLTNGLYNTQSKLPVNRDEYIELCTPICISYDILKIQETDEILDSIVYPPHFLFGTYNILKKITTIDDIYIK
jgi:2-C-methyl-D-erythritol 4-phosphate cytidylyltransferase